SHGSDGEDEGEGDQQSQSEATSLNVMPARLADRLLFTVDEQALVMARTGLQLPETDADLSRGEIAGVQAMPQRQLYFVPPIPRPEREANRSGQLLDTLQRQFDEPVTIRLSKGRYPWED